MYPMQKCRCARDHAIDTLSGVPTPPAYKGGMGPLQRRVQGCHKGEEEAEHRPRAVPRAESLLPATLGQDGMGASSPAKET